MPSTEDHKALAQVAAEAREVLKNGAGPLQWIATTSFYEALHCVEAILASKNPPEGLHGNGHTERWNLIVSDKAFSSVWQSYKNLYNASRIARYMQGGPGAYAKYFGQPNAENLCGQWLGSIRKFMDEVLAQSVS